MQLACAGMRGTQKVPMGWSQRFRQSSLHQTEPGPRRWVHQLPSQPLWGSRRPPIAATLPQACLQSANDQLSPTCRRKLIDWIRRSAEHLARTQRHQHQHQVRLSQQCKSQAILEHRRNRCRAKMSRQTRPRPAQGPHLETQASRKRVQGALTKGCVLLASLRLPMIRRNA